MTQTVLKILAGLGIVSGIVSSYYMQRAGRYVRSGRKERVLLHIGFKFSKKLYEPEGYADVRASLRWLLVGIGFFVMVAIFGLIFDVFQ
jgi:hypothetical protein